jgi:hypothetical protein
MVYINMLKIFKIKTRTLQDKDEVTLRTGLAPRAALHCAALLGFGAGPGRWVG